MEGDAAGEGAVGWRETVGPTARCVALLQMCKLGEHFPDLVGHDHDIARPLARAQGR